MDIIILSISITIILLLFFTYMYGGISGAPWVPTSKKDVDRVFSVIDFKSGQKFIELGSGDGRIILEASKRGLDAKGYEVSLLPYFISQVRLFFHKGLKPKIIYDSYWNHDLSEADFVYLYHLPGKMKRMEDKLKKELKPGAIIISYTFKFSDWEPVKVDKPDNQLSISIYKT